MTAELNARGHDCSENTVANLMQKNGIRAKAPRGSSAPPTPGTACPSPTTSSIATSTRRRQTHLVADITYIPTGPTDGCIWQWSRPVQPPDRGWAMDATMTAGSSSIAGWRSAAGSRPQRSDRGSQYASEPMAGHPELATGLNAA